MRSQSDTCRRTAQLDIDLLGMLEKLDRESSKKEHWHPAIHRVKPEDQFE